MKKEIFFLYLTIVFQLSALGPNCIELNACEFKYPDYGYSSKGKLKSEKVYFKNAANDSVLISSSTYDKCGRQTAAIKLTITNDTISICSTEIDSTGKWIKKVCRDSTNNILHQKIVSYDKKGYINSIQYTYHNPSEKKQSRIQKFQYDKNSLIRAITFDERGRKLSVCEGGKLVYEKITNSDGKPLYLQKSYYDQKGNIIKKTIKPYRLNKYYETTDTRKQVYHYTSDSLLAKILITDKYHITSSVDYQYDTKNRIQSIISDYHENPYKILYRYDDENKITEVTEINRQDSINYKIIIRFNSKDKITEKQIFRRTGNGLELTELIKIAEKSIEEINYRNNTTDTYHKTLYEYW